MGYSKINKKKSKRNILNQFIYHLEKDEAENMPMGGSREWHDIIWTLDDYNIYLDGAIEWVGEPEYISHLTDKQVNELWQYFELKEWKLNKQSGITQLRIQTHDQEY